jgi:DNA polymerase III subunit gamma/tau
VSKALYRKYRSRKLADVVGQKHVTDILTRSLAAGRIAHAYLLTGPRGVGKTSIARILAHEINQLPYDEETTHLDIIEIDAASNNGVEDVRDLREKVQIAPVSSAKKVYIIDEVHMLSKAAFNALLKTLEEPPEHAVFILATTDADKLPATIISRTQRFSFRSIAPADAKTHLAFIAKEEGIKITDEALEIIAKRGDGSFRDSISLLDQLRSLADDKTGITKELVEESLGLAPTEHVEKLLAAYESKDIKTIVTLIDEGEQSGIQPSVLVSQLIQTVRDQIAEKPQLLPLLDQLLEVAKSQQPGLKLLTVLASHAVPKPKTAALVSSPAEVSASVSELEKIATSTPSPASSSGRFTGDDVSPWRSARPDGDIPSNKPASESLQTRSDEKSISSRSSSAASKHLQPESEPTSGPDVTLGAKPLASNTTREGEQPEPANLKALDWDAFIDHTRQNYVAIYSVLSKCGYEIDGDKLIIYTVNNFYKKKLDDAKYRTNIAKTLEELGVGNPEIETIGTPPPPKDSTAAAVAAIMGGGEEVSVDA